ncbi:hypothetical protein [Bradyrhizobium embrapense]|uniref:hypothetical protein n=1 Tax=Bradyrhizobium embrapense TaxID=630921 RepID=UPI000A7BC73D|nr:hypothetical protein [Bradyrhizobium embrapense]
MFIRAPIRADERAVRHIIEVRMTCGNRARVRRVPGGFLLSAVCEGRVLIDSIEG